MEVNEGIPASVCQRHTDATKASGVTKKTMANGRMVGEPFEAFETLIGIRDCKTAS